jgi:RNA polymerase sigma-70 factor, ECF subfamily
MLGRSSNREGKVRPGPLAAPREPAGAPEAKLHALYEQYFDFTWRSLKRLGVPEHSLDDATQEVFLVVYRRLQEFEGRAKMSTWIFRTAMNVAMHVKRSQVRSRLEFPEMLPEREALGGSPEEALAKADESRMVHALLEKLDFDQRAVLILAEFEEQSPTEIADTLGVPRNTVYSRLRAARLAFAEHLERAMAQESRRRRERTRLREAKHHHG